MNPPKEVYFVERIPPATEKKKTYAPTKSRFYGSEGHAAQFLKANKSSTFKVYRAKVEWVEVDPDSILPF